MIETRLTLDLGNSALKLARWGREEEFLRIAWDADWRGPLSESLAPGMAETPGSGVRVAISSVVRGEHLDAVVELCEAQGRRVLVNPSPPLEIACRDSHTIGMDRLYAATGVWSRQSAPAIVVDAGTALTVDALDEGASGGVFLGGAIAPGPELLARSLAAGGARLFEVTHDPEGPALGRDSAEALRAGVAVGFRGAAMELVRCVSSEAGLEDAPVWLTGGAAEALSAPGLFGAREVVCEPRLVQRGLLAALDSQKD
jgi:type III pantothenate kinase